MAEESVMTTSKPHRTPEEAAAASERGFAMTGLGPRILRTETASGFVLASLVYALEL